MRRVAKATAAILAALTVSLTGCVALAPVTPSRSPSPTFMCTPEAGGSEAPCSEQQYQEMKARDALYAEAEQVYRTFTATLMAISRSGGAESLPPQLQKLISGEELAESVVERLREVKRENLEFKGPDVQIVWAKRLPTREKSGSLVAMQFCGDSSQLVVYKNGKRFGDGVVAVETVYFAGSTNALTMMELEYSDVKKC